MGTMKNASLELHSSKRMMTNSVLINQTLSCTRILTMIRSLRSTHRSSRRIWSNW